MTERQSFRRVKTPHLRREAFAYRRVDRLAGDVAEFAIEDVLRLRSGNVDDAAGHYVVGGRNGVGSVCVLHEQAAFGEEACQIRFRIVGFADVGFRSFRGLCG